MDTKSVGLYIHIPFCKAKCHYCDFNSCAGTESSIPDYFNALKSEMQLYTSELSDYNVNTIFIGGGTPSYVEPHNIYEVLNLCGRCFSIDSKAEITMEANPGTLSYEKLVSYRVSGINRLSIGLQAWQNKHLSALGRIHRISDFTNNFSEARKAGFRNINVDLIFGFPGQTMGEWHETLANTVELGMEHVSCYSLIIEEGTVFGDRFEKGSLIPLEDDTDREMYHTAIDTLTKHGFKHYEISNFARSGYECRHNLIYWKTGQYIGIGAGAHSYFNGSRFNNVSGIDEYISRIAREGLHRENEQLIDADEQMKEFMMLGFRLVDGIDADEFKTRFGVDVLEVFGSQISGLEKRKLLKTENGRFKMTEAGLDLANQVYMEFV